MDMLLNLKVTQRAIDKAMLGVSLRNPTSNEEISRRTRVSLTLEVKVLICGAHSYGRLGKNAALVDLATRSTDIRRVIESRFDICKCGL
ncbi:jg1136 [Pararge aegeria aegeria]|uniref:Jg1136 protein n=1 Tax=Pararge aegeria aegeria TaxID=348720 RepID=A0A8S4S8H9_9NEOP|nr:jg1136 [Pararge aegeria aegeria]